MRASAQPARPRLRPRRRGARHVVLFASVRHKGKSLSLIAEYEITKRASMVASFAILFILVLTLAGLSIAVVNALFESA